MPCKVTSFPQTSKQIAVICDHVRQQHSDNPKNREASNLLKSVITTRDIIKRREKRGAVKKKVVTLHAN